MKVGNEKALEVNSDIKINVDEQQEDIKHLKEQCNMNDDNEVQEITGARNPQKNNTATCNHTFAMENGLNKHIQEEHTELW